MKRKTGRRPEPRIENLATHPTKTVGLTVAAEYLEVDERTLKARIDRGDLDAFCDERVCRIYVDSLRAYVASKRSLAS